MDLVDEEDGRSVAGEESGMGLGAVDDFADFLDAAGDGGECVEGYFEGVGDDVGKGGLADSGWSPEDEGGDVFLLDHAPDDGIWSDEVLLADVLVERLGTHSFCEGFHG